MFRLARASVNGAPGTKVCLRRRLKECGLGNQEIKLEESGFEIEVEAEDHGDQGSD